MAESSDEELYDYNPESVEGTYFAPSNCFTNNLLGAIACGDTSSAISQIEGGCELNLADARGYTALHLAVQLKRIDILRHLLIQPGIRINVQNNLGETPLFLSLESESNEEIVLILIESGCDINIANNEDVTPLHMAVRWTSVKIAHKLIEKGANVNSKDHDGYTPLHEAATTNRFNNVCMLLYYNASVNEKTTFFEATPFHMACNHQYGTESAKYLMPYVVNIDETDSSGCTPLYIALNTRSDLAIDIIQNGADVNVVVDETPCIYLSLFYETSHVFELIWNSLDCKVLLDVNYPILDIFFCKASFPKEQFLKCLYMIFGSLHIEDFIHQHSTKCVDSLFTHVAHKNLPLEWRIDVFYLFLSYGVPLFFNDICLLYDMYNFDTSLLCLLTSGCCIELNRRNRLNLLASRICFNNLNIYTRCRDYFTDSIYDSDRKHYYRFYTLPECVNVGEADLGTPNGVCTLLELSRDVIRDVIYKKHSKPYVFNVYRAFMSLEVPSKIRDILFLKLPLYRNCGIRFHIG